jgi:hypothetical protein
MKWKVTAVVTSANVNAYDYDTNGLPTMNNELQGDESEHSCHLRFAVCQVL